MKKNTAFTLIVLFALLVLAAALGLTVTAEGVETEEQLAWLRDRGCHFVQGYLVGAAAGPGETL